jgi:hypothetical protein
MDIHLLEFGWSSKSSKRKTAAESREAVFPRSRDALPPAFSVLWARLHRTNSKETRFLGNSIHAFRLLLRPTSIGWAEIAWLTVMAGTPDGDREFHYGVGYFFPLSLKFSAK